MDSPFPRTLNIERASTAERVAAVLRGMITNGELLPGAPLRESVIATSTGVSRNTVREAIRMLVHEGLATHHMHRSAAVARLGEKDVSDIFSVREILELSGVRASLDATPEELRELEMAVDALDRVSPVDDIARIVEADLRFHHCLVRFLRSKRLESFYQNIQGELRWCLSLLAATALREHPDPQGLTGQHRAIYERVAAREIDHACELLREHLRVNERRLHEIVRTRAAMQPATVHRASSRPPSS